MIDSTFHETSICNIFISFSCLKYQISLGIRFVILHVLVTIDNIFPHALIHILLTLFLSIFSLLFSWFALFGLRFGFFGFLFHFILIACYFLLLWRRFTLGRSVGLWLWQAPLGNRLLHQVPNLVQVTIPANSRGVDIILKLK